VFPLYDNIKSSKTPIITRLLIGLNVLVFLYEIKLGPQALHRLTMTYGLVPRYFMDSAIRARMGIYAWRPLFTFMFLHGGWLHILSNMWYLWVFGDNVEDRLGHFRFAVFYLLCGALSGVIQAAIMSHEPIPCIGASGAVAGVLGAYLISFPRARVKTLVPIFFFITLLDLPAVFVLGLWFVTQIFNGTATLGAPVQSGGVAYWAHIGGFVAGMVLVLLMAPRRRRYVLDDDGDIVTQ